MTDEDARRGQGGTELGGGAGQVIGTQAEGRVGRLGIGVRRASKVQAEHGHAELVEAARDLRRGGTCVTAAEAVGDQHHGLRLPVRQVQPPGQPVPACTGKRERSGLGHGDTFLRTAAGWPEALSAESLTRHTMTLGQAAALQFHCVDGCDSDGTGVQSAHPPRPDQEIH